MSLEYGDRVRPSDLAFSSGVMADTAKNRARRGSVVGGSRLSRALVVVLWDGFKNAQRLHVHFLEAIP